MIPGDFFPWQTHRTIAEVEETEVLRRQSTLAPFSMRTDTWRRLRELEARAVEPEGME